MQQSDLNSRTSPQPAYRSMLQSHTPSAKQLSVTQIHLNRAYTLKALEGHQEDLARKTMDGTIQRNETWRWLQDQGYRGPILKFNRGIKRTKTFEKFGFNNSWIILRIDESTGLLQQIWKGEIPQTGGWI